MCLESAKIVSHGKSRQCIARVQRARITNILKLRYQLLNIIVASRLILPAQLFDFKLHDTLHHVFQQVRRTMVRARIRRIWHESAKSGMARRCEGLRELHGAVLHGRGKRKQALIMLQHMLKSDYRNQTP